VTIFEQHLERRTIQESRAYNEFHRVHDFEHHMLVRFHGDRLTAPGALSMGFTRGKRLAAFGAYPRPKRARGRVDAVRPDDFSRQML
jgi:hypothetical protein